MSSHKETIVVRKDLDFGLMSEDIPTYWQDGDPYKTRVFDAIQATFPDGERFFISSVRAFKDKIQDSVLRQEVRDFTMQEGQHGIVHANYNKRLKRQGIPIEKFTSRIKRVMDKRLQDNSPEYNIALTSAFEHYTAMMAELFFAHKSSTEGADDRIRAMFAWHAIEEMEHRAVAFDVMKRVARVGYFRRALAMTHVTVGFSLYSLIAPFFMLRADDFSRRQCLSMFVKGLPWQLDIYARLLPMLLTYFRHGFHPEDMPAVHNYEAWLSKYEESHDPIAAAKAMHEAAY